jgi:hypothetical protein
MDTHQYDFYTWTHEQATLLKEGRLADLDIEHLIEELEDMGASKEQELENRLGVLLAHLLKWQYQRKNSGLKDYLGEAFENAYGDARLIAVRETGMPKNVFPDTSPFTFDQAISDHWPD